MKQILKYLYPARYYITASLLIGVYLLLVRIWQNNILVQEKGLFSPFQSGISLIRYLGIVFTLNTLISISSLKRDKVWIIAPLIANIFLLAYTAYYIWITLQFE